MESKNLVVVSSGVKSFGKNDSGKLTLSSTLELVNTKDAIEACIKARGLRHCGTSVADNAKSLISITLTIDTAILTAVPDVSNPVNWIIAGKSVEVVDSDNLAKRADLTGEKVLKALLVSAGLIEASARGLSETEKVTREIAKLTERGAKLAKKAAEREAKLAKQMKDLKDKQSKAEKESALRLEALKNPGTVPQNSADVARANGARNRHTS